MKTGIHPDTKVVEIECSCGNKFNASSATCKNQRVEICAACHPFYTGEERILKTGAVDKFYARMEKAKQLKK